jgi:tetrahydromethanopterin S-methyltransferase subunit B
MSEYNGTERRAVNEGNDKLIIYRLDKMEEAVNEIKAKTDKLASDMENKTANIVTTVSVMKNEMEHIAKESGKTSGAISGVATGVVMGLISLGIGMLK